MRVQAWLGSGSTSEPRLVGFPAKVWFSVKSSNHWKEPELRIFNTMDLVIIHLVGKNPLKLFVKGRRLQKRT